MRKFLLGLAALFAFTQASANELTKTDADAWLDGQMPYMLDREDIAGAVVVIVKDGQILTERGFGYSDVAARKPVDPETTLFRPGSISKLFTWTSVMQLVEQGKIDLDADVNTYLDFKIPPFEGKPITMRHIMTHTPGFEEAIKGLILLDVKPHPLGEALKRWTPTRVYAPGSTPAYSNYATAIAGYIVERVSGMPFDDYLEKNIFQPLGMEHATFRQPLPDNLKPFMSKGYERGSGEPKGYEVISLSPAGAAAISGADMAKFMLAHLNHGQGLMKPETADMMHATQNFGLASVDRMALGFYEQWVNGTRSIGHGGDSEFFHSYVWIWPELNVGMFVSFNSAGAGNSFADRLALFEGFADRYYPAPNAGAAPVELPTAKEHAKMLAGSYISSRGAFTNFFDALNFIGQTQVGLDKDGRPLVNAPFGLNDAPRKWIETAPFLWQDAYGHQRLGAVVENGQVTRWTVDAESPFTFELRAPWYRDAAWLKPFVMAGFAVVILTALFWPIGALYRRRYGANMVLRGRDLQSYRASRLFTWLALAAFCAWALCFEKISSVDTGLDWLIWLLEIFGTIGIVGLFVTALWDASNLWRREGGLFPKIWGTLLALAGVSILWVSVAFHVISFGTNF